MERTKTTQTQAKRAETTNEIKQNKSAYKYHIPL